ncbi:hypothetical protein B0O99DRAFT_655298 [Bisporella sp. PMI_857]|nr:hypothetical protein B0O99DRAFT_655298 [Bisporella sp. PMI_857]
MSYQNFESSGAGPSNPRQAPPSPSQGISHGNGMNGIGMNPGMVGFPTPAGHQADLNYIMGMVEELSRTLAHNQNLTASIVQKAGEVRELARSHDLSNDEILARAAEALNSDTTNLEQEISKLKEDLASAEHARDENWKLVIHGCNILADIRDKMHKFRADTDRDVLAWHKSYRDQLAHERAENLRLNCLIYDMQAAAARANGHLRDMRRYITDHPELEELRREVAGLRTDRRMWKRMAMPLMTESDSEWSDDDDLRGGGG